MKRIQILILLSLLAISCSKYRNIAINSTGNIAENKTSVIAHRGAYKHTNLPENSLPALKAAIDMNCYGSELDVHMTADEYIVVNHDPHFHQIDIQNSNLSELRKFKLSNGDELPLLSDFLEVILKQKKTKLIVEIKPSVRGKDWAMATAKKVTEEIIKLNAGSHVEYISFDFRICKEIIKIVPQAKVHYLSGDKTPAEIKTAGLAGLDYNYKVFQQHPEYIIESKKLGLLTNAWTVNDPVVMDWLIKHEVDFITTNEPELLFKKLKIAGNSSGYVSKLKDTYKNNQRQFYYDVDINNLFRKQINNNKQIWRNIAV